MEAEASLGAMWREMVCVRVELKVWREVRVELPLGRRMRRSFGEVGSRVVEVEGGVQEERCVLRLFGS